MIDHLPSSAAKYKHGIRMPVLVGLGEYDWVWQGIRSTVEAFCMDFVNAPSIEAVRVEGRAACD